MCHFGDSSAFGCSNVRELRAKHMQRPCEPPPVHLQARLAEMVVDPPSVPQQPEWCAGTETCAGPAW
eukprot:12933890-Prorocentrum_lima.AAC.1